MNLYRPCGGVVEAVQWNGANETDVRRLLGEGRPFPRLGWFVVRRSGGVDVVAPEDFSANYEPIL